MCAFLYYLYLAFYLCVILLVSINVLLLLIQNLCIFLLFRLCSHGRIRIVNPTCLYQILCYFFFKLSAPFGDKIIERLPFRFIRKSRSPVWVTQIRTMWTLPYIIAQLFSYLYGWLIFGFLWTLTYTLYHLTSIDVLEMWRDRENSSFFCQFNLKLEPHL